MFKKSLKGRICSMALAGAMAFTLIPGNALSSVNAGTDEALEITEDNFWNYFEYAGEYGGYVFTDSKNNKEIKFSFDEMTFGSKTDETRLIFENKGLHIYSENNSKIVNAAIYLYGNDITLEGISIENGVDLKLTINGDRELVKKLTATNVGVAVYGNNDVIINNDISMNVFSGDDNAIYVAPGKNIQLLKKIP